MTHASVGMTDAEIEAAIYRSAGEPDDTPHATSIDYIEDLRLLIVHLSNGLRLALPIENLQGLERATPAQLRTPEIHGRGYGFGFPDIDADFYVPALIEGVYGNKRWMSVLGKKGGASNTPAKQRAARANGAKGGRPRKQPAENPAGAPATRPNPRS